VDGGGAPVTADVNLMPITRITGPAELAEATEEAGRLLQLIQDYCKSKDLTWSNFPPAKVRFPRGYIRIASLQRKRMPFVRDSALKKNLAYTLILSDTVLWLSLRTDISGTALEMLTKLYVFLIGTLCESITKDYLKGICGKNFNGRAKWLEDHGVIDQDLRENLEWMWDVRNRMHLFQLDAPEYENEYDNECHFRCVSTFRRLLKALSAHHAQNAG
jgi:hypothetical protein